MGSGETGETDGTGETSETDGIGRLVGLGTGETGGTGEIGGTGGTGVGIKGCCQTVRKKTALEKKKFFQNIGSK